MQEHQERTESHDCTCLLCIQTELLVNPAPRAVGGNTLSEEEWVRYHEGSDEDRKQIDDEVKRRLQEAMERRARWTQEHS